MSVDLPVLEQPQQTDGGVWTYVSPSRLNTWETHCTENHSL